MAFRGRQMHATCWSEQQSSPYPTPYLRRGYHVLCTHFLTLLLLPVALSMVVSPATLLLAAQTCLMGLSAA